jgi:hypothetical protein
MAAQFKAAGAKVAAMFSNDIVGASQAWDGTPPDPRTVRLFVEGVPTSETAAQAATRQSVGGEDDGPSRQLARFARDVAENDATGMRIRVVWRRDRFLRGSDHIPFLQQGYPAGRLTEPRENFDHEHQDVRVENGVQFGDLPQFVDFQFLARVTRVVASSAAALARSPRPPANTRALSTELTYDTHLRWNRDPEPDVVGYEVVWRDSLEPLWTHARFVGNIDDYVLQGINKDDWQVGVRAVDRNGNKSPVAFAGPASS